jgi:hypothetical protein
MMRSGWFRAAHVKNIEMQKMRKLLSNRKLLKRKLVDIENHVRGALRTYGLLVGAVSRGLYDARVRELIEHTDIVFATMIETMLDVRGGDLRWLRQAASGASPNGSARSDLSTIDDRSRCRTGRIAVVRGRGR